MGNLMLICFARMHGRTRRVTIGPRELARRVGFEPIENDCVAVDVQWLFCASDSEASANVIAQTDGY